MGSNSPLRGKDLFDRIISTWRRRSDPTEPLTLNQIANISLGSGNSRNSSIVGRTLNEFIVYFHPPSREGYNWRVNWSNIQRDHPHLVATKRSQLAGSGHSSPLPGMKQALDDEIREVRRESEAHPIRALGAYSLGAIGDGSFLYEALIELPGDSELPIPEGVSIRLRWHRYLDPSVVDATLLSYDALTSTIIFNVDRPLSNQHLTTDFIVLPRIEELLKAIQSKVATLASDQQALSWRLLRADLQPKRKPWIHNLDISGLDDAQLHAVDQCLNQDITFLWGPPGTGKTHTLCRLMAIAALGGQKIIATAIANVAVDQIAIGLVRALESFGKEGQQLLTDGRILRFGHPRLPEVIGEPKLFPSKQEIQRVRKQLHEARLRHREIPERNAQERALSQKHINDVSDSLRRMTKELIEHAQVVLTTAVQTCIEPAFNETTFDMMVVDEASMMSIPYLACMGLFGRERLIIAGDFRQLGPIAVSRSSASYEWLHRDAFELVGITKDRMSHPALEKLTTQRRMHQRICNMINESFYDGDLLTKVTPETTRACDLSPLPGNPVVLVSLLAEDGSEVQRTENGSRYNRASVAPAVKLARQYVSTDLRVTVGIITPYRAQVNLIKKALREPNLPQSMANRIKVGTIHAFQGSEDDVIIWDLVDTQSQTIGKLYQGDTGDRLANVAISRAKGKLVIIGDRDTFSNAPGANMVKRLSFIMTRHFSSRVGNIVSVREL